MLRQHRAGQPSTRSATPTEGPYSDVTPVGRRATTRRFAVKVVERALGECLAPTPGIGLLVLLVVAGLLAVIAVTLSVGNALLVLIVAVVIRISCERRRPVV
jgi:hypothetical protein